MAWTSPITWVAGQVVTAATMNAQVSDNLNFLHAPPRCRVFNSAATISLTNGVFGVITWDSETYDTDTMHSIVSNTSRLTATTAGLYAVGGFIGFASSGTGLRGVNVRSNAAGSASGGTSLSTVILPPQANSGGGVPFYDEYSLAAGDYIEVFARQDSGGALSTVAGGAIWTTMRWVASS